MARGSSPESPGRRVRMIFLVYCIASLFCYLFLFVSCPYVILLIWRDIAYLWLVLKVPLNPKQTNAQTLHSHYISGTKAENNILDYMLLYSVPEIGVPWSHEPWNGGLT